MNLRRQLLLVSLLILVLPWAGCQFIRETETALREGQQQMLARTGLAIADSLSAFHTEFGLQNQPNRLGTNQIYGHPLSRPPIVDGYFDDWPVDSRSMSELADTGNNIQFIAALYGSYFYLFVDAADSNVIYRDAGAGNTFARYSDRVTLVSASESANIVMFDFQPEAPGPLVPRRMSDGDIAAERSILAHWQDTPLGFRLEARVPRRLIGERIGVVVTNTAQRENPGIRLASFAGDLPGHFVAPSSQIQSFVGGYAQDGLRVIVTDRSGWRLATAGDVNVSTSTSRERDATSGWLRLAYGALLEPGNEPALPELDPSGLETSALVQQALDGKDVVDWFRSSRTGRAVVVVARPVWSGNIQTGALVLQQDTAAILSLTNAALARLVSITLIAMAVAAAALLGYASWLSLRIRRLSSAAEQALDDKQLRAKLPSATSKDEIGDLSRSFSQVLQQLGEYNEYLRTLASKLSHELRTPLTIVSSSLENLEHEELSDASAEYTARARDGTERLRKILNAMSEANRVEELMKHSEADLFCVDKVVGSAVAAYSDAWPDRRFSYQGTGASSMVAGSPELIIQMLDKLVDNAVDFTNTNDEIAVSLLATGTGYELRVDNPGPPLPENMRARLFDSMVSLRDESHGKHLGLGLHIVRLVAEGHGGSVHAENRDGGVSFVVHLPKAGTEEDIIAS